MSYSHRAARMACRGFGLWERRVQLVGFPLMHRDELMSLASHLSNGELDAARALHSKLTCIHQDSLGFQEDMGHLLFQMGCFSDSIPHFRRVLQSPEVHQRRLARFYLSRAHRYAHSLPEPTDLFDVPFNLQLAPKIALFGPPHSGIASIAHAMATALSTSSGEAVELRQGHEPELHLGVLLRSATQSAVIAQCMRCTEANLQLLHVFAPKPIFVMRSMQAVLRDQAEAIQAGKDDWAPAMGWSESVEWALRRSPSWLIDQAASFVQAKSRLDVLILDYQLLRTQPDRAMEAIGRHIGRPGQLSSVRLDLPPDRPLAEWAQHQSRWARYASVYEPLDLGGLQLNSPQ